jgi:hypothetical protein
MKLEKREITLNEKDSIKDMVYFEEKLLLSYTEAIKTAQSKCARELLCTQLKETVEELRLLCDLL